jgi:hypothetical protein
MLRNTATNRLLIVVILSLSLFASALVRAGEIPASGDIVGTVTTAIGEGRIVSDTGQESVALRGTSVRSGDRVETAIGGHVHIRFVDGGLVSVRPLSRLLIEAYRNNKDTDLAAIKFRLEEGVMRSITGQWGEAHRDRFRLNTPVAAIGIKGTDFVVKADQANTFASVISGAIVMAPLEGSCAQTLGPCADGTSVLLSAEMTGVMLELQRQDGSSVPRLVPAIDLLAGASSDTPRSSAGDAGVHATTAGDDGASNQRAENIIEVTQPNSKPLVWLHNTLGWNVPSSTFSQRYSDALAAGRTAVIGNLFITLYRDETAQPVFQPIGGAASFTLGNASATFTQPVAFSKPVENVAISGAALTIDFSRAMFSTRMDLSSPSLGRTEFSANGNVSSQGLFIGQQAGQNLAGALSMDGREAGYQFSKALPTGDLSGITLWGR